MIFATKPTIVGHRGFGAGERAGYCENTLESCLAAVAHGLSWVELDVRRSLDGQLVIRHDPVTGDGEFVAGPAGGAAAPAPDPRAGGGAAPPPPRPGRHLPVPHDLPGSAPP